MNEENLFREESKQRKGYGLFSLFFVALLASFIGVFVAIFLLPTLIDQGIVQPESLSFNKEAGKDFFGNENTQADWNASQNQQGQGQGQAGPNPGNENNNQDSNQINQNTNGQINNGEVIYLEVSTAIVDAVDKVKPAVVGILNIQRSYGGFFAPPREDYEAGSGSGVVFQKDGNKALVVTNHHVIEGADSIKVVMSTGEQLSATLIGTDELTDLAVLEIDGQDVSTVAEFGDSTILKPGEPAIAIGNPLGLEFAQTVTVGVISAVERTMPVTIGGSTVYEINVLQTDAAINFGNSGGALVNIRGQVIGINSAKIASSGVEGIGFAIPMEDAKPIIQDLIDYGQVQRPYLGISLRDLNTVSDQYRPMPDITEGVIIADNPTGPAAAAGLQRLDVIVEIDGRPVDNSIALRKILYNKRIGDTVTVAYYRGADKMEAEVKLAALNDLGR